MGATACTGRAPRRRLGTPLYGLSAERVPCPPPPMRSAVRVTPVCPHRGYFLPVAPPACASPVGRSGPGSPAADARAYPVAAGPGADRAHIQPPARIV